MSPPGIFQHAAGILQTVASSPAGQLLCHSTQVSCELQQYCVSILEHIRQLAGQQAST